jgi:hypothetical protein
MTPADFRRIELSLEGVEDVSQAGLPEIFLPIPGRFGMMGYRDIRLAAANENIAHYGPRGN